MDVLKSMNMAFALNAETVTIKQITCVTHAIQVVLHVLIVQTVWNVTTDTIGKSITVVYVLHVRVGVLLAMMQGYASLA
jgi:hypothetical protein